MVIRTFPCLFIIGKPVPVLPTTPPIRKKRKSNDGSRIQDFPDALQNIVFDYVYNTKILFDTVVDEIRQLMGHRQTLEFKTKYQRFVENTSYGIVNHCTRYDDYRIASIEKDYDGYRPNMLFRPHQILLLMKVYPDSPYDTDHWETLEQSD
jgi:hypothetical protein